MKWNEVTKKLKKLGYIEGDRKTHYTIWNCPCAEKSHPVGVGNHGTEDCHFSGLKSQLGIHKKEFGKT